MRVARTRPPTRPAIRLCAAPPLDPPFDDEPASSTWLRAAETQLTLALPTRPAGRSHRPIQLRHRGEPGTPGRDRSGSDPACGPQGRDGEPTSGPLPSDGPPTASPEARQAARRFLITCLEILNGYRPVAQIRPMISPVHRSEIIEELIGATGRLPTGERPGRRTARLLEIRRLRVCEPRSGVAEAAAALGCADRTFALPFRLERRRGSWVGTAVKLL